VETDRDVISDPYYWVEADRDVTDRYHLAGSLAVDSLQISAKISQHLLPLLLFEVPAA